MSASLDTLPLFVEEVYGDGETPDHIYLKVLTLARMLEEEPTYGKRLLLVAIAELTMGVEDLQRAILDVHSEIDWLDEHLQRVYPAWYLGSNQEN